jgi:hypothetical protein
VDSETFPDLEELTDRDAGTEKPRPAEPPPDRVSAAEAGGATGGFPEDPDVPLPYLEKLSPEMRASVLASREVSVR